CTRASTRPPAWCSTWCGPTSIRGCPRGSSRRCLPESRPGPARGPACFIVVLSLHLIALALYGVATALALAPFLGAGAPSRVAMLAASAAGAALHVVGVSQLSVVGLAPSLSLLALCLILLQLAS